jgi:DNA-binding PadR family transcriptional regulator
MLTLGPMSGYDLKQHIASSIGNFWSESYGQIYPALKRLEREGYVTCARQGKGGRAVYSITEAGRERLREWLAVPPRRQVARNELLLKLFFGRNAPVTTTRAHVLAARELYEADLQRYEHARGPLVQGLQQGRPGFPFYLSALNFGIQQARMVVDWCDETLAMLNDVEEQTSPGDERPRDDE